MKKIFTLPIILFTTGLAFGQNVGIGTTNPNANLQVNGTLKISNGTQGCR